MIKIPFVLGTIPRSKAYPNVDPTTHAHELPPSFDKLGPKDVVLQAL